MDAGGPDRSPAGARQISSVSNYCRSPVIQESRAQATLAALKSLLALSATVRRDGAWKPVPAAELVPADVVKRWRGARGCAPHRGRNPARPIHAHWRVGTHRSGRWRASLCRGGGTGRWRKSRPPARVASSAAPRSWCVPHMSLSSQQKAVLRVVRNLAAFKWRRHQIHGGRCRLSQAAVGVRALARLRVLPTRLSSL